jgi:anti-sigma factor RsiW
MADESIHELSAAYALHALDAREAAGFEAHLAGCEDCRAAVASFAETAAALAYAPESPVPPAALRGRILTAATAERSNVVPLRRRRPVQIVAAAAAVAAGVAIGFGVWASSLNDRLQQEQDVSAARAAALHIVAAPGTRITEIGGGHGSLAVARDGRAVLMLGDMAPAPSGHTYEAWVIPAQSRPQPAGVFGGGNDTMLALQRPVPEGAVVAVTVERGSGSDSPHSAPILSAKA